MSYCISQLWKMGHSPPLGSQAPHPYLAGCFPATPSLRFSARKKLVSLGSAATSWCGEKTWMSTLGALKICIIYIYILIWKIFINVDIHGCVSTYTFCSIIAVESMHLNWMSVDGHCSVLAQGMLPICIGANLGTATGYHGLSWCSPSYCMNIIYVYPPTPADARGSA